MVRGEVFRLPAPRGARGREQRGARFAVIVQADEFFDLSTVIVSPTSTSARPASFRPTITLEGQETRGSSSRRRWFIRSDLVGPRDALTRTSSVLSTKPSRSS